MFRLVPSPPICLAAALLLGGCGQAVKTVEVHVPDDAAVIDALADPIMTDPDLASQNQAHAAIVAAGPVSSALPPIDRSSGAIATAVAAAKKLVGAPIADPPMPSAADLSRLRDAVTAAQMASAARIAPAICLQAIAYTARWAAALPAPLQVYPRGAVEEAAGTDTAGCGLRVVHFRTPVPTGDIVAFYHARLRTDGYTVELGAQGADRVLRGRKGAAAYAIYVRPAEGGLTGVDLIVAGA